MEESQARFRKIAGKKFCFIYGFLVSNCFLVRYCGTVDQLAEVEKKNERLEQTRTENESKVTQKKFRKILVLSILQQKEDILRTIAERSYSMTS